jgi:hypothetical protein
MLPPRATGISALHTDLLNAQDDIKRLHDKANALPAHSQDIIDNQKVQASAIAALLSKCGIARDLEGEMGG